MMKTQVTFFSIGRGIYVLMFFLFCVPILVNAQTEVMGWGNITGIRVDGQLMDFESSLRVVDKNWSSIIATGKERQQHPVFHRQGNKQLTTTSIERIHFGQTVEDISKGVAKVTLTAVADTNRVVEGVFFCISLPEKYSKNGMVYLGNSAYAISKLQLKKSSKAQACKHIKVVGEKCNLDLDFRSTVTAFIRKESGDITTLYIQLAGQKVIQKKSYELAFNLKATGEIDHSPVEIFVNKEQPGRLFIGLGGNFRLQNPRVDPQVIDYCLNNLRVSWGRVELPWRNWQPEEFTDPLAKMQNGESGTRVIAAMEMAQRLAAKGMPVIVSAWFPPTWAIAGDPKSYVRKGGIQAYRLDPDKKDKIYKSITDYLIGLKQKYGVEATMFSFNESDLGIDVLHTPQEHADFIKELGAYMASRGLATKMLLGDNSDATTYDFILPAMNDPETYPYIGAVSFHSWRGCDDETLRKWAAASRTLNVPLLVGEGSTDASAHVYPEIFAESTFALYEINLYVRLCAICQPLSILQWQLTSDYSILWGDGVYGSTGPLRPTQRFWNLKQLASTPENAFALPVSCDRDDVNCAAFGNLARGQYAVHLVNNGASRIATVKGLPGDLKVRAFVTNRFDSMKELPGVNIEKGMVKLELPEASYITLFMEK